MKRIWSLPCLFHKRRGACFHDAGMRNLKRRERVDHPCAGSFKITTACSIFSQKSCDRHRQKMSGVLMPCKLCLRKHSYGEEPTFSRCRGAPNRHSMSQSHSLPVNCSRICKRRGNGSRFFFCVSWASKSHTITVDVGFTSRASYKCRGAPSRQSIPK